MPPLNAFNLLTLTVNATIHTRILSGTSNSGFWPSFSAWLPLIYDTLCILLTLWRCAGPLREHAAGVIVKTLVKDGAIYYRCVYRLFVQETRFPKSQRVALMCFLSSVIFCVNLVLAIMIVTAPVRPDLMYSLKH